MATEAKLKKVLERQLKAAQANLARQIDACNRTKQSISELANVIGGIGATEAASGKVGAKDTKPTDKKTADKKVKPAEKKVSAKEAKVAANLAATAKNGKEAKDKKAAGKKLPSPVGA